MRAAPAKVAIVPITERAGLREALAALHSANVRYENAKAAKIALLNIIGNPMAVDPRSRTVYNLNGAPPPRQQLASRRDVAMARVALPKSDLEILEAELALEDAKASVEALRVVARAECEAEVRERIRALTPAVARALTAAQMAHHELEQIATLALAAGVDVRPEVLGFFLVSHGLPGLPSGGADIEETVAPADATSVVPELRGALGQPGGRRFWRRKSLTVVPAPASHAPTAAEEYLDRLRGNHWLDPADVDSEGTFRASFAPDTP